MQFSPKVLTDIRVNVLKKLDEVYKNDYSNKEIFIKLWLKKADLSPIYEYYNDSEQQFIVETNIDNIIVNRPELFVEMAIDLGVEVPNITYSIKAIKYIPKENFEKIRKDLENACSKIYYDPDASLRLANNSLELVIKKISECNKIKNCNPKDTSYDLLQHILKEFNHYPKKEANEYIKKIGSSLINIAQIYQICETNIAMHMGQKTNTVRIFMLLFL